MFACLLFKTKLIFMPHGGRFLLNGPRAFPFQPPIRLPGLPLSLTVSYSPRLLVGDLSKSLLSPSTPFSAQISSVTTFVLCQLGSRNFSFPVLVLLPASSRFHSLHSFSSWGLWEVAGGCTKDAAVPPNPHGLTPELQVSSASRSHPAARRRRARLGSSRLGSF